MATKISFFKLTKAAYEALGQVVSGAIYFVTDENSGKIYVDQKCYGEMNTVVNAVSNISYVNDEAHVNSLKVEYTTGEPTYFALPEGAIYTPGDGIKIENKVISALDETLNEELTVTGVSVGNLTDGTKIDAGTSLQNVLKQMLTKELDYTVRSLPAVQATGVTNNKIYVVGTKIYGPIGSWYTDGTFQKWDGTTVNAGCQEGETTISGEAAPSADNPYIVKLGSQGWNVTVAYGASTAQETLKTNLGNPSKVNIPADSKIVGVSVIGCLPVYATSTTSGELSEQPLQSWKSGSMIQEITLAPSTPENPRTFSVPGKALSLEMFNTMANKYEAVPLSDYEETNETREFGEDTKFKYNYYVYAYKGAASGEVKLKVKFNSTVTTIE